MQEQNLLKAVTCFMANSTSLLKYRYRNKRFITYMGTSPLTFAVRITLRMI